MKPRQVWIVGAVRTPMGGFLGALSSLSATDLGALALAEAIRQSGVSHGDISEVLLGCVLSAGLGQAPARQASLKGGVPQTVPCTTVNKVCGSGLKSVMIATDAIVNGQYDVAVVGGMESMSNAPFALSGIRKGLKFGHSQLVDTMVKDGLWDVYNNFHMGEAADMCAQSRGISRQAQDAFAEQSYRRAQQASTQGWFSQEVVPVQVEHKGDVQCINCDEDIFKAQFERFAQLKPAFGPQGTVTAANASNLNDGAAALVLADATWAQMRGLKPIAKIIGHAQSAREPKWFTVAPVDAIATLLKSQNWSVSDVDLWEINEAFAVVTLAVGEQLGLPMEKVNVHGGAIALGHPIGASGARILVTLVHAMQRCKAQRGVASLCIGGGEAVALAVELV